jgi:hypothetical protein
MSRKRILDKATKKLLKVDLKILKFNKQINTLFFNFYNFDLLIFEGCFNLF